MEILHGDTSEALCTATKHKSSHHWTNNSNYCDGASI
jgi:hypothetical protein